MPARRRTHFSRNITKIPSPYIKIALLLPHYEVGNLTDIIIQYFGVCCLQVQQYETLGTANPVWGSRCAQFWAGWGLLKFTKIIVHCLGGTPHPQAVFTAWYCSSPALTWSNLTISKLLLQQVVSTASELLSHGLLLWHQCHQPQSLLFLLCSVLFLNSNSLPGKTLQTNMSFQHQN